MDALQLHRQDLEDSFGPPRHFRSGAPIDLRQFYWYREDRNAGDERIIWTGPSPDTLPRRPTVASVAPLRKWKLYPRRVMRGRLRIRTIPSVNYVALS